MQDSETIVITYVPNTDQYVIFHGGSMKAICNENNILDCSGKWNVSNWNEFEIDNNMETYECDCSPKTTNYEPVYNITMNWLSMMNIMYQV